MTTKENKKGFKMDKKFWFRAMCIFLALLMVIPFILNAINMVT